MLANSDLTSALSQAELLVPASASDSDISVPLAGSLSGGNLSPPCAAHNLSEKRAKWSIR